jgi:hypothetical protein
MDTRKILTATVRDSHFVCEMTLLPLVLFE